MPISNTSLRLAALVPEPSAIRTLFEAKSHGARTVFLSHSHRDSALAKGLANLLSQHGWRAYIDWQDSSMPESTNEETAAKIQQKIRDLDYFVFLATENSMASRWCPWEIGYADGKKPRDRILIVPTSDNGSTHGNEYIQLYRRIDMTSSGSLEVFRPGYTFFSTSVREL